MGGWFQRLFEKNFKKQTVSATVISRRVECTWVVAFRTDCGEDFELNVSEEHYRDLREGSRVQLTRKGNDLLSFTERE